MCTRTDTENVGREVVKMVLAMVQLYERRFLLYVRKVDNISIYLATLLTLHLFNLVSKIPRLISLIKTYKTCMVLYVRE